MAELVILTPTTDRDSPPQGRRQPPHPLNTIIEDDDEDVVSPIRSPPLRKKIKKDRIQDPRSDLQAWLTALEPTPSDNVPTPRGFPTTRRFHFIVAPALSSLPSSGSAFGQETSSQDSSFRTNPWLRQSVMTDLTEFDDLYGVSDDETESLFEPVRLPHKTVKPKASQLPSMMPFDQARKALPPLMIPRRSHHQPNSAKGLPKPYKLKTAYTSPIPPTPPTAVAMSPAMLSYMQSQHAQPAPTISSTPSLDGSLDGSLTSEQLAATSAPPTPIIHNEHLDGDDDWTGIQLQPVALETLQALSGHDAEEEECQQARETQVIDFAVELTAESTPSPRSAANNSPITMIMLSSAQPRSVDGLTRLDIPSPAGFFAALSPHTRGTWHLESSLADDIAPPTSTTAEQFYRGPWNVGWTAPPLPPLPKQERVERPCHMINGSFSNSPVDQVIEVLEHTNQADVLTARRIEHEPITTKTAPPSQPSTVSKYDEQEATSRISPKEEEHVAEIVVEHDPKYAGNQEKGLPSKLDRTEKWLRAQFAYLRGVDFKPADLETRTAPGKAPAMKSEELRSEQAERHLTAAVKQPMEQQTVASVSAGVKKSVRFCTQSTLVPATGDSPRSLPSKLRRIESAYYRAFQSFIIRSTHTDVFVHRVPRFEALQAARVSLRSQHRDHLLGKYQLSVVRQSVKRRMSANVARGGDEVFEDPDKIRSDKEAEALQQMSMANWHVAATKILNGGRLLCAPVHERLGRNPLVPQDRAASRTWPLILDLGGQATCDWAWHAALQYPNAKVHTVTTKAIRQLSTSNLRGPPNHRQVAVTNLCRLPFADDHFDVVAARDLHSILRSDVPGANDENEWDSCLREVLRVLKPGGYFEFNVMDSDIVKAGPLGLAKSVEFGFTLKTLGYDPAPTKSFIPRLSQAGFEHIRRAWVLLPLGPKPAEQPGLSRCGLNGPEPSPPASGGKTLCPDAMAPDSLYGSTDDAAAITGIAATWSWERWILRCEIKKAAGERRSGLKLADTVATDGGALREAGTSLDSVHSVIEEGRRCRAGLRMLKGFARKPVRSVTQDVLDAMETETIDVMLDF